MPAKSMFIQDRLNDLYTKCTRSNLKEPKSSLPKVPEGLTMKVVTSYLGGREGK